MKLHPLGTLLIGLILGLLIGFIVGMATYPSVNCVQTPFETFCPGLT